MALSQRVTEDLIRSGVSQDTKERLSTVFLVDSLSDPFQWRCQVFLLRVRALGFMCLFPAEPSVQHALSQVEQSAGIEEKCVITEVEVDVESAKGKALGTISMLIADIPWSFLGLFRKMQLKGGSSTPIYSFKFGTSVARPNVVSAEAVADRWIAEMLDADAAREYTTAEEGGDNPDAGFEVLGGGAAGRMADVEALHVRIAQLESLLQARGGAGAAAAPAAAPDPGAQSLFAGARREGLSAADWAKLHRAAGAAPKRIARAERAHPGADGEHPAVATLHAEQDREVVDLDAEEELEAELTSSLQAVQDPTHRLLILQMKQTQALMKTLAPKAVQDPFTSLLGGQDSGSGGSGSGSLNVKGYAARELYLKHLEEDAKVVEVIRRNARQELGISPDREEPSLLRSYLEQRIAVADTQNYGTSGLHDGMGLGASSQHRQRANVSFLRPDDDLCGTSLPRWRQDAVSLVAHGSDRAELPAVGHQSQEVLAVPICTTSCSNLGGSKCELPQRHRHLRDSTQADRSGQSNPGTDQGTGGRSSPQTCTQKEAWKGGRRHPRTNNGFVRDLQGIPEQCSKGVSVNTNSVSREPLLDNSCESKFFNCNFDWSKSSCHVDNFAILCETMKLLEQIPCGFNVFQKLALVPAWLSRPVAASAPRNSLWPVPPPLWSWTENNSPNPKRRKKLRKIRLKHFLLQKVVCMLNWIALGYPKAPPKYAQAGEPTTFEQDRVLETLQGHIDHFCDLEPIARADLGRFGEKFDVLRRAAEELPPHVEVDLEHMLHEIEQQFDAYTKHEKPHFAEESHHKQMHQSCEHQPGKILVPSLNNKPVIASRIKWKHPPSFDPRPYLLDPVVASVFETPDSLRLPQSVWPSKPKANVHCSRPELLQLMKIWDCKGALKLIPCEDVDPQETVGLFAVPKDDEFDRLIINPTVLNSRMAGYSCYTKKLAPGALLSLLSLQPNQVFRYCADDLSDFYYTFKVSDARAKRNCIGKKIFASEVKNLACYDPHSSGPFYPALATLAMGDNHAVEIAQKRHHALLELEASCMRPFETLEYRKPVRRGDFIELLAIDDHIGVQRCTREQYHQNKPLRDTEVFEKSSTAYNGKAPALIDCLLHYLAVGFTHYFSEGLCFP